jgi:hypothetical protein
MWIRPVSNREGEAVSQAERWYTDGTDPLLLDVIDVPLVGPHPGSYQSENWLLEPSQSWSKIDRLAWDDLGSLAAPPAPLWANEDSTNNGFHDQISVSLVSQIHDSLRLLYVPSLEVWVSQPGASFGDNRQRVQGRFEFAGIQYWLWVTDPVAEQKYRSRGNGSYTLGECYLTISVGEEREGYHYKLIAAVIERP